MATYRPTTTGAASRCTSTHGGGEHDLRHRRAVKVSFDRPLDRSAPAATASSDPTSTSSSGWRSRATTSPTPTTSRSTRTRRSCCQHKVDMVSGHSEYWSLRAVERLQRGPRRRRRTSPPSAPTPPTGRSATRTAAAPLVCYKTVQGSGSTGSGADGANDWGPDGIKNTADDALGARRQVAGTRRRPPRELHDDLPRQRRAPPATPTPRRAAASAPTCPRTSSGATCTTATTTAGAFPMQIPAGNAQGQYSGDRIWRNTGHLNELDARRSAPTSSGWEWDAIPTQAQYLAKQPAGVKPVTEHHLQTAVRTSTGCRTRAASTRHTPPPGQPGASQAVKYTRASGALVFAAGTNDWANAPGPEPGQPRSSRRPTTSSPTWACSPITPVGVTIDPPSGQPAADGVVHGLAQPGADRPDRDLRRRGLDAIPTARSPSTSGTSTATAPTRPTPAPSRSPPRPTRSRASITVRLRVTDEQGATAARPTARSSIDNTGSGSYRRGPGHHRPRSATGAWARRSGTTLVDSLRLAATRPPSAAPTLGVAGALTGDPDSAARFDGTNDAASATLNLVGDQQGDGRVLDEVERLRQRRRPGDGVHARTSTRPRAASWSTRTRRRAAASSASRIGNGASRNNVLLRPSERRRLAPLRVRARHARPRPRRRSPRTSTAKPVAYTKTASRHRAPAPSPTRRST